MHSYKQLLHDLVNVLPPYPHACLITDYMVDITNYAFFLFTKAVLSWKP